MNFNLKNQKGLTLIEALILVIIIIIGSVLIKNFMIDNSIENVVLTKDNIMDTIKEYSDKAKDSDDSIYVSYAIICNISSSYDYNYNSEEASQYSFKSLYGKTIKDLKNEGKTLMKEHNVTIEQLKEFRSNLLENLK